MRGMAPSDSGTSARMSDSDHVGQSAVDEPHDAGTERRSCRRCVRAWRSSRSRRRAPSAISATLKTTSDADVTVSLGVNPMASTTRTTGTATMISIEDQPTDAAPDRCQGQPGRHCGAGDFVACGKHLLGGFGERLGQAPGARAGSRRCR